MEHEARKISKIAREVNKFVVLSMKEEGIGSAEFDFIHLVRHNPGITQKEIREELKIDKGAAARRCAALEKKGYLIRKVDEKDKRRSCLYATEKAEKLKNSKVELESYYYDYICKQLSKQEQDIFLNLLDKVYCLSKQERKNHFNHIKEEVENHEKQ